MTHRLASCSDSLPPVNRTSDLGYPTPLFGACDSTTQCVGSLTYHYLLTSVKAVVHPSDSATPPAVRLCLYHNLGCGLCQGLVGCDLRHRTESLTLPVPLIFGYVSIIPTTAGMANS